MTVWVAGIALVFLGVFAVAISAGILFIGIFDADVVEDGAPSGVDTVSRESLSRAVEIIDARTSSFERLKTNPPASADPSR